MRSLKISTFLIGTTIHGDEKSAVGLTEIEMDKLADEVRENIMRQLKALNFNAEPGIERTIIETKRSM